VRRALILGACVLAGGLGLLPLTEALPPAVRSFWPVVAELVNTVGWSLLVVNSVPILVATTPPEHLRAAYALREALMGCASLTGLVLAGLLPDAFSTLLGTTTAQPAPYRFGLLTSVLFGVTALLLLLRIGPLAAPDRRPQTAGTTRQPLSRLLVLLLLCGFLNQGAVASCRVFTYAYMDTAFAMAQGWRWRPSPRSIARDWRGVMVLVAR
jgi:hypothetical protein